MDPAVAPLQLVTEEGWRLELSDERLRLSRAGEETIEVPRASVLETIERAWLREARPFFVVRSPRRKLFKLSDQNAAILDRWLGPDYGPELRHQLRHRLSYALPTGIFYILTDLSGVVSWILGGLLVLEGLLHKVRPSYWLFLLEVGFWLGLLLRNGWQILAAVQSGSSGGMFLSGLLAFLSIVMLTLSVRLFLILRRALRAQQAPADQRPAA